MEKNKVFSHVSEIRKRLGFSQEELAKKVHVSRQTIIALEKGNYSPSVFLALKIAKCLGLKVDELFFLVEENNLIK